MTVAAQTILMGWFALFLFGAGAVTTVYISITDPESPLAKLYHAYARSIDRDLKSLFIHDVPGAHVVNVQIGAAVATLIGQLVFEEPLALVFLPVIVVAPKVWIHQARAKRMTALEAQLDTFLMALANALKASPSLGDALGACTFLMRAPIREELELTMKENQLGMPLDQALLSMAQRVGSRALAGTLTTVLIGRQTGGDLPKILETSAGTLRKMARLEGVVRTKTAEGKAQAWVLGGVPPFLVGILNWIDPEWLQPLSTTFVGYIIVMVAVLFWVAAIFAARKILAVDI